MASTLSNHPSIVAAAVYADAPTEASSRPLSSISIPVIHHLSGRGPAVSTNSDTLKQYFYPNTSSYKFATPFHSSFHYNTESISHTRNLTLLKEKMGGPYFDLETIWEEHTYYEFADRSMEHTMSTMVQEPYVNHVPTVSYHAGLRRERYRGVKLTTTPQMTGGIGRGSLSHFYQHNFIFNNSADTELELISRIKGIDRIVDEFIFKFTHDQLIDWMYVDLFFLSYLPCLPPNSLTNFFAGYLACLLRTRRLKFLSQL